MALSILDKYHPGITDPQNFTQGRDFAKAAQGVAGIASNIYKAAQADKASSRVEEIVLEYNRYMSSLQAKQPIEDSIYAGMSPSTATEKVARLLMPWDKDMADKFAARAAQMGAYATSRKDAQADYAREQAGREKLKAMEIKGDLDKKMLEISSKGDVSDLEQIWKDASRVLAEATRVSDAPTIKKYSEIVAKVEKLLAAKRPELWGTNTPQNPVPGATGAPGSTGAPVSTDVQVVPPDDTAITKEILGAGEGKKIDGVIDGYDAILRDVQKWAEDNGINLESVKYKNLVALLESRRQTVREQYDASEARRKEGKEETKDLKARALAQKPIFGALKTLLSNPADVTSKVNALNMVLRKESGAAIGSGEYANKLQAWLGPDDYANYIDELGGWKQWLAIKSGAGELTALRLMGKYVSKVPTEKISSAMNDYLEEDVVRYLSKGVELPAPTGNTTPAGPQFTPKTGAAVKAAAQGAFTATEEDE